METFLRVLREQRSSGVSFLFILSDSKRANLRASQRHPLRLSGSAKNNREINVSLLTLQQQARARIVGRIDSPSWRRCMRSLNIQCPVSDRERGMTTALSAGFY